MGRRAPNAGIDDHEEDRVEGKIWAGGREDDRRLANPLRRDLVADISQLQFGVDAKHDPLHHPDKGVTVTEIRQQCDDP